jgi:conserved hypothetical protein YidD
MFDRGSGKTLDKAKRTMARILIYLIRLYRYTLSPWLGNQCRFYPTCSCYAEQAIARYGVLRGGWLALHRLLRCHPWRPGGVDPVPERLNPDTRHPGS